VHKIVGILAVAQQDHGVSPQRWNAGFDTGEHARRCHGDGSGSDNRRVRRPVFIRPSRPSAD
jgi:hypothetical protein